MSIIWGKLLDFYWFLYRGGIIMSYEDKQLLQLFFISGILLIIGVVLWVVIKN